ncbi:hypothetical protein BRADI_3g30158v3 [Brachypodium distachyon]|uniref:Uncharacterized protein n=1 Tax=Brachypodium distachyon TaxID=15368 RepID=A0A0Q3HUX6_BRADI|nr:hypothetical protein BRADI_3g30158v3 [Brachypodium distachyon]
MASSQQGTRMTLLLVALLLLSNMASVSHGRRIPELDAAMKTLEPPPAKGYSSEQTSSSSSTATQHPADDYPRMHSVSKRLVPQGPNPLHN